VERLCDLFFEFSNEDRLNILYKLKNEPLTVTGVSRELDITTQEASRHISRLNDVGLTYKDPEGLHHLTPLGEITLHQLKGFRFISDNREYFKSHEVTGLPNEYLSRIGELENSRFYDDVMVIIHNVDQMIREAEEYVYRLTDRYIVTAIPEWEEAIERGVEFRLLEPIDIVLPPDFDNGPVLREALRTKQFKNNVIDEVKLFLAFSEKEVAAICFPRIDGKMDYRGFSSKDESVIKWAFEIFDYYWKKSIPKTAEMQADLLERSRGLP
jgi:predicted transcriptional regulator